MVTRPTIAAPCGSGTPFTFSSAVAMQWVLCPPHAHAEGMALFARRAHAADGSPRSKQAAPVDGLHC